MTMNDSNRILVGPRHVLARSSGDLVIGQDAILLRQFVFRQRPRIAYTFLILFERRCGGIRYVVIFSLDGR